ncbi:MAG: hypothetical protein JXQ83_01050 [Candidatus Glassbacteria bacterium]|nr:hypothetical protein [Candidatus Glassbacteria bacterium]
MKKLPFLIAACLLLQAGFYRPAGAVYVQTGHRPPARGEVEVAGPGSYAGPGTTYLLTRDLSAAATAVFLGKDVTLDLNGYTLTYAAAGYEQVPNCGFERGLEGWDTSRAPGAKVVETARVHVFIGENILSLPAGQEIVSGYITLPVAGRSYYAICGVAKSEMQASVYVEDENGDQVRCEYGHGDSLRVSCPVQRKSPRLGGGFVFAHLHGLPAGRYRVRVRAETDCLLDEIDIRPALDAGVAIVEDVLPLAHNDDQYSGLHCAFFDYASPDSAGVPAPQVPRVSGPGTVTIRNGVIAGGAVGVLSWGVQSTARQVKVVLENVRITASGINTNAVDAPRAVIRDCRFEIDTPFIINRHVSIHAVSLWGPGASEVSLCEFFGGQGCLTVGGENTKVHHNLFVNRQMVTNHYCVMVRYGADGSKIFSNQFKPEIGSGVEIFRAGNIAVFGNTFQIEASPPTCEYGHEEYSTAAVRVADYGAEAGSSRGCDGNRIYDNTFHIVGRDFPDHPDYIPMAWAFFHSASGGETYVYGNQITVEQRDPGSKAEAAAFYLGGTNQGGRWYDNRIVSNVPAFWIATMYGNAANAEIYHNAIVRADHAPADYEPVRIGWKDFTARDIVFRSNETVGSPFGIDLTGGGHSFAVYWNLTVQVQDRKGRALPGTEVQISDRQGREVFRGVTGPAGSLEAELPEYRVDRGAKTVLSPYRVSAGGKTRKVDLDKNLAITVETR